MRGQRESGRRPRASGLFRRGFTAALLGWAALLAASCASGSSAASAGPVGSAAPAEPAGPAASADAAAGGDSGDSAAAEPTRVTTSFEAEHVGLVIRRVARIFSGGFGRAEAEHVAADIDKLRSDQEAAWDFTAIFNKKPVALHIRAVMDDMAMVDLDFATDPAAAARIRREIDAFSSEHGL